MNVKAFLNFFATLQFRRSARRKPESAIAGGDFPDESLGLSKSAYSGGDSGLQRLGVMGVQNLSRFGGGPLEYGEAPALLPSCEIVAVKSPGLPDLVTQVAHRVLVRSELERGVFRIGGHLVPGIQGQCLRGY